MSPKWHFMVSSIVSIPQSHDDDDDDDDDDDGFCGMVDR